MGKCENDLIQLPVFCSKATKVFCSRNRCYRTAEHYITCCMAYCCAKLKWERAN